MAKACAALCEKWCVWNAKGCVEPAPFSMEDMESLSAGQRQEFLAQLLIAEPLTKAAIEKMQSIYNFNEVKNCEILFRYLSSTVYMFLISFYYHHLLFKMATIMSESRVRRRRSTRNQICYFAGKNEICPTDFQVRMCFDVLKPCSFSC